MHHPVEDPEVVRQRMQAIVQRNPACEEFCELVGGLVLKSLEVPASERPIALPRVDPQALKKGTPLLDMESLELDWPERWALAQALAESLSDRPGGPEAARAIAGLRAEAGQGREAGAFRAVLKGERGVMEQLAEARGTKGPVLWLVLRMALRPALVGVAKEAAGLPGLEAWEFGHCPVCGQAPALAELGADVGSRRLHCWLCESSWDYPRLKCPFCESEEPGIISYLRPESEEGMQLEVCESCAQYIPTLDMRKLVGPVVVPLEEVATWHLMVLLRRVQGEGQGDSPA